MLGIVIGIASVVLMLAVGDAVRVFIDKELAVLGSNQLIVQPGQPTEGGARRRTNDSPSRTIEDAEALNTWPSVRSIVRARTPLRPVRRSNWTAVAAERPKLSL